MFLASFAIPVFIQISVLAALQLGHSVFIATTTAAAAAAGATIHYYYYYNLFPTFIFTL